MASVLLGAPNDAGGVIVTPPPGGGVTPPPPPAIPAAPERNPLQHLWTGWDGSVWDLTGLEQTGVYLRAGVRGLNAPEVAPFLSELAGVDGAQYRGHRVTSREVFWPLSVWADGTSQEWLDYDRAFWSTLQPGKLGTWRVRQPTGQRRYLRCRFAGDGGHAAEWDPSVMGWQQYGVYLRADQPYWEGDPITKFWGSPDTQPFLGGDGGGGLATPFFISSASSLATAVMDNPGDVDAWPVWTITGPTTTVSVGIGDRQIVVPFALADGEQLVIDTRPTEQTAFLGSSEVTRDLTSADFAPIPAGKARTLALTMVGDGSVEASIVPLYMRAW